MRQRLLTFSTLATLLFLLTPPARAADPPKEQSKDKKPDVAADINKPRADARKISFEASEGTWMSVDVSPDGRTLVFDLLGDIYSLPIAGGKATALTSRPRLGLPPALLAGRQVDRLRERPRRDREHLGHGRRRPEPRAR